MQKLISCLQKYGAGDSGAAKLFSPTLAAISVDSLGVYVSGEAIEQRARHPDVDLHKHLFPLSTSLAQFSPASTPLTAGVSFQRISCSTLYEDKLSTLCWFVIPPGHTLPLHDHPCMRVWQRVLFGEVHITALDWCQATVMPGKAVVVDEAARARERATSGGTAAVVFNGRVAGCAQAVSPSAITSFDPAQGGGVVHAIHNPHATSPALFIDIIAPPYYVPPDQWPCTYYVPVGATGATAVDLKSLSVGSVVTLEPRLGFGGVPMDPYLYVPPSDSF